MLLPRCCCSAAPLWCSELSAAPVAELRPVQCGRWKWCSHGLTQKGNELWPNRQKGIANREQPMGNMILCNPNRVWYPTFININSFLYGLVTPTTVYGWTGGRKRFSFLKERRTFLKRHVLGSPSLVYGWTDGRRSWLFGKTTCILKICCFFCLGGG